MSTLPRPVRALRNALLADGSRVDVEIDGPLVTAVRLATGDPIAADDTDLTGYVLLPAPAEPHAHLDKARSWDLIAPPQGDLGRAIESWLAYADAMTEDSIADRARTQALAMLRNGTTAIRSHVDLLPGDDPLRGVRALLRVRAELRGLLDLELVALSGDWMPSAVIEEALELGVDLVGGAPHLAQDPAAEVRRLLAIAAERGVGVDLHTDEALGGDPTIHEFARIVREWTAPATAGHCVRFGTLEPDELAVVVEELVAADIGVVTLPITNLYLQGWDHPVSTPRGLTPLRALLDAGVRVGAGADNVRDPFNPVGRSDALETASLLVTAGHLALDEAYAAVSDGSRSVMSLPAAGPVPGQAAELLAVRADSLAEVVAEASPERIVIHRGRIVARSTLHTELAPLAGVPEGVPA